MVIGGEGENLEPSCCHVIDVFAIFEIWAHRSRLEAL